MKIKVFTSLSKFDNTWTGGSVHSYDAYSELSNTINNFIEKNNLELIKVDYSEQDSYNQHGPSERNRDIFTKVIANVFYNGNIILPLKE
jgi:hypothetical protein